MPKIAGHNYYAHYYNDKGEVNKKRKAGQLGKPTSAETLEFLENSITKFEEKYGTKVKWIRMSQEMKDMIDERQKGKAFLKKIKLVVGLDSLSLRTIHIGDTKEVF